MTDDGLKKKQVLVVEDDPTYRELLVFGLTMEGYECYAAENGAQAIDVLENLRPDIILVDMLMPDADGCEVARAIRAEGLTVPIVALTGSTLNSDVQDCLAAGCDQHLAKPVGRESIVAVLSQYLAPGKSYVDGPIIAAPGSTE